MDWNTYWVIKTSHSVGTGIGTVDKLQVRSIERTIGFINKDVWGKLISNN